jgi:hypothetical protein
MSRKLEEYLKRERARLDVESPDDSVWERIERRLPERGKGNQADLVKIRWIRIRNIAAAAIVVFCLGYITNDLVNAFVARRTVTLSSIDRKLGQREEQYRTQVSLRTREISMLGGTGNANTRDLFNELSQLDTVYQQLLTDLRILGPDEKVINTIFDTYENRIRILELIILETNKTKIHENNEEINL